MTKGMLILTLFGLLHFRRTPEEQEFPQPHGKVEEKDMAKV